MPIAFFVSSLGDTDLAKATMTKLLEQNLKDGIFIIPLTQAALSRTEDLIGNNLVLRIPIEQITKQTDTLSKNKIALVELNEISSFIEKNNIQRIYVGIPSSNSEVPLQIASHSKIPCTIAYEYMFKPANHSLWNYVDRIVSNENCDFAVPLEPAKQDILAINPQAKIYEIGHLSIDRAQIKNTVDIAHVKKSLSVKPHDDLIFISGTTQPHEVDNLFLDALLSEIAKNKYPNIQLRMGLHPGVNDPDSYLQTLLKTCEKYPQVKDQFKIILTTQFEKRLNKPASLDSFILRSDTSGTDAAQAADKVTQAVPGALLNEAAFKKPTYFHDKSTTPYLPRKWFSDNLAIFFTAKPESPHSREELKLEGSASNLMANLMAR